VWRVDVRVPVHLRYQAARSGGGTADAIWTSPAVFMRCMQPGEHLQRGTAEGWFELPLEAPTHGESVQARVPVGDLDQRTCCASCVREPCCFNTVCTADGAFCCVSLEREPQSALDTLSHASD
jgi:hypothetical protein